MATPPIDEWGVIDHLTSWITWIIGAIVAIISSAVTGTYFIATIKGQIEELNKRMDDSVDDRAELRKNLRDVVHELRNEFHKAHGDNQSVMRRIDEHILRVESRSDQRFDQIVRLMMKKIED